ncbi:hypothetical protein UFOVP26_64 [uncultured Caudovirales phage]|uniref:Uncharacterized protein n=1 Tax=uncultured Caudovirales phage TaxID=2100421 RepID=A0A6J5KMH6_9CAUD|nr:hypothetical protein UFOVP26_64 [uncultured Caudovirales phage]CAB4123679.1 hypothetical protein UFOVP44_33 [uncultured Caudovirales phage]CAB5219015.1 hypothetical protein UFOVP220_24 [uncultured Caudovirales phage]
MPFSEQFIQNMAIVIVIGVIAIFLTQPLALFGILLLGHLPEIQYVEQEDADLIGQLLEPGEYDGDAMGFLANLKNTK